MPARISRWFWPCFHPDRERGSISWSEGSGSLAPLTSVVARLDRANQYSSAEIFADGGDYWIPAFAGMTLVVDERRCAF